MSGGIPAAPFLRLSTLWIQVTGTWCNLRCVHCINASGPRDPWLPAMSAATIERHIVDAERLGVKEIYFTGGEPFLHPQILPLLGTSLAAAPTTVLTNGTLVTDELADALAGLATAARYSLEIRVSVDDVDETANDRIRGRGAFARATGALRRLHTRGLLPILTATAISDTAPGVDARFRQLLRSLGIDKPRVKLLPVFKLGRTMEMGGLEGPPMPPALRAPAKPGRSAGAGEGVASPPARLTEDMLEGFDRSLLQCSDGRVVTSTGVYACPILAGLPVARLGSGSLEASFVPAPLAHAACVTCWETGTSCRN